MFSSCALYAVVIVFIVTFIRAFIDPSKAILITINEFNEANIEFLIVMIIIPELAYGLIQYVRNESLDLLMSG